MKNGTCISAFPKPSCWAEIAYLEIPVQHNNRLVDFLLKAPLYDGPSDQISSTYNVGYYSGQEQALLMLVRAFLWNTVSLATDKKSRA